MTATPAGPSNTSGPHRRLDEKLARILVDGGAATDFIIADAKDADMAFGVTAPGPVGGAADGVTGPGRYRTRQAFQDDIRAVAGSGAVDVMLMSASNAEVVTADGPLAGGVTVAVRGNDTTDIWNSRGAAYPGEASRPFRTVDLPRVTPFCDLVLYSMTFNGDLEHDLRTVSAYREFRREATDLGLRHFLEVFNPNAPTVDPALVPAFVNDSIIRALAGVTSAERPIFLKVAYNGADAMAELCEHDASLVVGILGGSAGTTRDTFELLSQAQASGARVALFGRKIQRAESQLDLVRLMRAVVDGNQSPADAVRAYHDALATAELTPTRPLDADLAVTDPVLASS